MHGGGAFSGKDPTAGRRRRAGLYRDGVTSYREVLDTERQLFDAELTLGQGQRDQLLAVVRLYRALGGGWGS